MNCMLMFFFNIDIIYKRKTLNAHGLSNTIGDQTTAPNKKTPTTTNKNKSQKISQQLHVDVTCTIWRTCKFQCSQLQQILNFFCCILLPKPDNNSSLSNALLFMNIKKFYLNIILSHNNLIVICRFCITSNHYDFAKSQWLTVVQSNSQWYQIWT